MNRRILTSTLCALLTAAGAFAGTPDSPHKVDVQDLVRETQKQSHIKKAFAMVWWVPTEFWEASASSNPKATPQDVGKFTDIVRPYTIVALVDGEMGDFATFNYRPVEETRKDFRLVGSGGILIPPIPEADLPGKLKNLLGMLQPIMANALGPMGQNIHFCVFPNQGKDKQPIVQAAQLGSIEFNLRGESFKWRLPLASLVDPKTCPTDQESWPGNWIYCPIHGTKLQ